ncbi:branched-chain amino acid ABC transporter permease [Sulfitobacter pseudonitzschiae]|uniref:Branched-chain amino acid transport system permease protein n=2 Tax=Roseobacteraceae TaxID=2854170 RepID=A0A975ZQD3_9RHOB|nr:MULTISPECIES: branched-chain amino acid ABC transporter permease [Roseobacteraceae]MBM1817652.1 branched-chain amino acid ABC transporter permease [Pseudosulfitobacter pseudonitzschiae]MBM1834647.1 branched-chain amino acid ABC transporter permease [Pseudosulfitobacter pseudonitzschiae]MBM1839511.1 branched-chain amino acid ABC transporter permease [Pseudosulfitobacter pseudonitzschiae]MBM1844362.1 branched-chain amino acid ABC transporter permease [Pseudosulfitobacter pseudonitzschiae]MBM1|tara:strand:+ start:16037 stop:16909 length:873 start_codon:yes stop_codon:yes gene_type:complete
MQIVANIIVLTSLYALVASGYVLVYKVSRVLNLAHGELMILGAYLLVATSAGITSDPLIAIALTAVFSIIVGLSVYLLLMREMTGQPVLAAVLTTVALGILLRGAMVLIWGPQQLNVASMLSFENASVVLTDSIRVSTASLWLVICTVVVYLGLLAFLHMSRWGMRMRASGQNPLLAAQRGINLHTVYALAWTLSTFSGSIAGVLVALDSRLDVNMAVIGLKAFPAALVGGLDSLHGALIGAGVIAVLEVLLIHYVNPLLSDVVPFLVLIAILIVRPWGLFGTKEELNRV